MTSTGPAGGKERAVIRAVMARVLDTHWRLADGSYGCGEPMCGAREAALTYLTGLEFEFGLGASADDEEWVAMVVYDERTRVLADEVRAEHKPDDTGACPKCRRRGCAAYRLAARVLAAGVQAGLNVPVIGPVDVDGTTL